MLITYFSSSKRKPTTPAHPKRQKVEYVPVSVPGATISRPKGSQYMLSSSPLDLPECDLEEFGRQRGIGISGRTLRPPLNVEVDWHEEASYDIEQGLQHLKDTFEFEPKVQPGSSPSKSTAASTSGQRGRKAKSKKKREIQSADTSFDSPDVGGLTIGDQSEPRKKTKFPKPTPKFAAGFINNKILFELGGDDVIDAFNTRLGSEVNSAFAI